MQVRATEGLNGFLSRGLEGIGRIFRVTPALLHRARWVLLSTFDGADDRTCNIQNGIIPPKVESIIEIQIAY
jgi:hypothetical protein